MSKSEMDDSEKAVFDPFRAGPEGWCGLIVIRATSFDGLKHIAKQIVGDVAKAQSFTDLPIAGGGGNGASSASFNCLFTSPIEKKITELRRQADDLERSLGDGATVARL